MTPEEARDMFGELHETEDSEAPQWEADMDKIRAAIMKWASEVDSIDATAREFSGPACVDHCWEWLHERLGEGFKAVFQKGWYQGSESFDRVGKSQVAGNIETMYSARDDFQQLVDEKWREVVPDFSNITDEADGIALDVGTEEQAKQIEDNRGQQASREFFVTEYREGTEDYDPITGEHDHFVDRIEPDVSQYKYHYKRYVMGAKTIQADGDSPNAAGFVESFADWLDSDTSVDSEWVVGGDGLGEKGVWDVPTREDAVGWARELWQNDEMFREHLKMKWNREVEGDETTNDDIVSLNEEYKNRSREKKGQQKLGDMS